ncbi:MAG: recombination-associated protein RdgC [Gammaproteobacteria bacterium]|nr:recombination-associated protein RdgC [Gammaproteobacteria bacterium]
MWFKNLHLFRLTEPFTQSAVELRESLEKQRFQPCSPQEPERWGWTNPVGGHDDLLLEQNGRLMIAAHKEEKILPASVVNEHLAERLEALQEKQQRRPRKAEREALKEEVLFELRPRAFSRRSTFHAYLNPRSGWLIINSASQKNAEALTELLRKSLGSLPIASPVLTNPPGTVMTHWLSDDSQPPEFTLEEECELHSPQENGGIVRCRQQPLSDPEIQGHLQAGKTVVKLSLNWRDRFSFVLDDEFSIKRLRFLELLQDKRDEIETDDDPLLNFEADFKLMSGELEKLLKELLEAFGDEANSLA